MDALADAPQMLLRRDGPVATIALNRPEKMNVRNAAMEIELRRMMAELSADAAIRVIVLTGSGKAICAGVDGEALKGITEGGQDVSQPAPQVRDAMGGGDFEQRYSYLLGVPKPDICALNGAAAGVGVVLALCCDIRWASSRAKPAASYARRGLVAEHGIAWLLPRQIGLPRAMEWLLGGRTLSAQEAERMGVVSEVFEHAVFEAQVAAGSLEMANTVSPRSTRIIKRQLLEASGTSLAQACKIAATEVSAAVAADDFREGVRHFLEKRPPSFTGV